MTIPTQSPPVIRETIEDMDKTRCSTTSEETKQPSVARFTPGPWVVGPDYLDDAGYREIAIQAANGAGGVCTPASVVLQFPTVGGMQEANACLIAAAPTMASYIKKQADKGDAEAAAIWEAVNANPLKESYPETTSVIRGPDGDYDECDRDSIVTDGHILHIADDELDELVWIMTHREAVVTMSRQTLRALVEAYGRDAALRAPGRCVREERNG